MTEKRYRILLAISILISAILACGGSDAGGEDEEAAPPSQEQVAEPITSAATDPPIPEPLPLPTPLPIGLSRGQPYPRSGINSVPNWNIQVLETMRGEAAWQAIQAINQFNEPAPGGQEYLLVKLYAKSTYTDAEEHPISGRDFKVTGDRLIEYTGISVVEPDPVLDARVFTGGEAEGWEAFLIGQGEETLILIFDELRNYSAEEIRFIALDDNASISVSPALADIQPTNLNLARNNPAPRGETVITADWEITVREVIRGDQALRIVQETNQFNDPPAAGMEYIAVKVHVRYIDPKDKTHKINRTYFKTTGDANVVYDSPSIVAPAPALDATLFPGGEYEGWVVVEAAVGEMGLNLIFEPLIDFSGQNKAFIAIDN
jgi:hypothetical protein